MFDQRMLNRESSDTVERSSRYRLTILRPSSIQAFSLGILACRVDLRQPAPRDLRPGGLLFLPLPLHGHRHALAIIWEPPRTPRHRHVAKDPSAVRGSPITQATTAPAESDHNPAFCIVFDRRHILDTLFAHPVRLFHSSSMVTRCAYASHRQNGEPGALQLRRLIEILHNPTPICEASEGDETPSCAAAHARTRSFPRSSRIPMRSSRPIPSSHSVLLNAHLLITTLAAPIWSIFSWSGGTTLTFPAPKRPPGTFQQLCAGFETSLPSRHEQPNLPNAFWLLGY